MDNTTIILLVIPIVLLQLGLVVAALIDLVKRDTVRFGSKALWALIILLFGLIGPVVYLLWGRES